MHGKIRCEHTVSDFKQSRQALENSQKSGTMSNLQPACEVVAILLSARYRKSNSFIPPLKRSAKGKGIDH